MNDKAQQKERERDNMWFLREDLQGKGSLLGEKKIGQA
jgi:hypothetical protein